jgi:hypothetical protein
MRDREVPLRSPSKRVVVLGDSFVEGWGVAYGRRFTEILESTTKVEHMNFGTAGGFGSTQAYLPYKTLASRFDHTAVVLSILPANDFLDDEPRDERLRAGQPRRPFLLGTYPDYRLTYPENGPPRSLTITDVFAAFSATYRTIDHVATMWRSMQRGVPKDIASYYRDYTPEQFGRLRYAIEQIAKIAQPRPFLVFTIPRHADYFRLKDEKDVPKLRTEITDLAKQVGFTYVDLLSDPGPNWRELFFGCDSHWSPTGHEAAAKALAGWQYYQN